MITSVAITLIFVHQVVALNLVTIHTLDFVNVILTSGASPAITTIATERIHSINTRSIMTITFGIIAVIPVIALQYQEAAMQKEYIGKLSS
jgi:hypothetical protein